MSRKSARIGEPSAPQGGPDARQDEPNAPQGESAVLPQGKPDASQSEPPAPKGRLQALLAKLRAWRRATRPRRVVTAVLAVVLALVLVFAVVLWFFTCCGWGLYRENNPFSLEETPVPQDQMHMRYDGVDYVYDDDVVNILILGVDEVDESSPKWEASLARGGQSDTLVLCSFNTKTGRAVVLPIPRDIVSPLGVPAVDGKSLAFTAEGPLCLAHSYGADAEQSAQLCKAAVSHLFYGLPIHRFVSLKIEAVRHITDFVGGVKVVALADFYFVAGVEDGTDIILDGEMAELFVRGRSMGHMTGENLDRMVRQRLYMFGLLDAVKQKTAENALFPLGLYREMTPYIATDLSLREMGNLGRAFLAGGGELGLEVMSGDLVDGVYLPQASFLKWYVRNYCMKPAE